MISIIFHFAVAVLFLFFCVLDVLSLLGYGDYNHNTSNLMALAIDMTIVVMWCVLGYQEIESRRESLDRL